MGKRERRRRREQLAATDRLTATGSRPVRPQPTRFAPSPADAPPSTDRLAELVAERRAVEQAIDAEVDRLVVLRASWPAVATALGVTRQAARQRWLRRH